MRSFWRHAAGLSLLVLSLSFFSHAWADGIPSETEIVPNPLAENVVSRPEAETQTHAIVRVGDATPFQANLSAYSPLPQPPSAADILSTATQLEQKSQRLRAAGWTTLAFGAVGTAAGVGMIASARRCQRSSDCREGWNQNHPNNVAMAGIVTSLGVTIATTVAVPNLVVGAHYRRAATSLRSSDATVFHDRFSALNPDAFWSEQSVIGLQKQRSSRALRISGWTSLGVFTATTLIGVALPSTYDESPIIADFTEDYVVTSNPPPNYRGATMAVGIAGASFIAIPMLISSRVLRQSGRRMLRNENGSAPQMIVTPTASRDGGGAQMLMIW